MANLLPDAEKRTWRREQLKRLGVVFCAGVAISAIVGTIFLIPSYALTASKAREIKGALETLRELSEVHGEGDLSTVLEDTKRKLTLLAEAKDTVPVTQIIERISAVRPQGVSVEGIYYGREEGSIGLVLKGNASTRDALLDYREVLEKEPFVANASLPLSNFTKSEDIEFSLELLITEETL